jgi:glycosyltransferase involved in cell wall biosynthesis
MILKKNTSIDISVILSTYNRAAMLSETLEKLEQLSVNGLSVEFVIIDNNSTDPTSHIIDSFESRLTMHHLFERSGGRNVAFNTALREVPLGSIVVFTDDDVDPDPDWLEAIWACCEKWKDCSVFGGRIYPVWPDGDPPACAEAPGLNGSHDLGKTERLYPENRYPWGANVWFRRDVFEQGYCFNEQFGPRPKGRMMGGETVLLMQMRRDGYSMVYCPAARLGHRLQSHDMRLSNLFKRAAYYGRGMAHWKPLPRRALWRRSRVGWRLLRGIILSKFILLWMGEACLSIRKERVNRWLNVTRWMAYHLELFKVVHVLNDRTKAKGIPDWKEQ